jgi:DNA-binding transcriptional ArsR family regulator
MSKVSQRTQNQLTDVVVAQGFNADQIYREEAKAYTQNFLAKFGIFVGLYNKLNNTSHSVENALCTSLILDQYIATAAFLQGNTTASTPTVARKTAKVKTNGKPKTTKALSYADFQEENGTAVAHAIYAYLKKQNQAISRSEIAKGMGIRLSTVCGQIFPMEEAGLVTVVGTKIDESSGRSVEILIAR